MCCLASNLDIILIVNEANNNGLLHVPTQHSNVDKVLSGPKVSGIDECDCMHARTSKVHGVLVTIAMLPHNLHVC